MKSCFVSKPTFSAFSSFPAGFSTFSPWVHEKGQEEAAVRPSPCPVQARGTRCAVSSGLPQPGSVPSVKARHSRQEMKGREEAGLRQEAEGVQEPGGALPAKAGVLSAQEQAEMTAHEASPGP